MTWAIIKRQEFVICVNKLFATTNEQPHCTCLIKIDSKYTNVKYN